MSFPALQKREISEFPPLRDGGRSMNLPATHEKEIYEFNPLRMGRRSMSFTRYS